MTSERERSSVAVAIALAIVVATFITWPAQAEVPQQDTRATAERTEAQQPDAEALADRADGPPPASQVDVRAEVDHPDEDTSASTDTIDPAYLAIAAARAKIGTPYRWAGTGPNAFDCSGLTQFAYRAAGIELPHNSRAQYSSVEHVSVDELQPGDLVFSGSGGIGHVGLYIGDGQMIHAPQSGETVKVSPLRRNLIGAGRPVA